MRIIEEKELNEVQGGGGVAWGIAAGVIAGITFIIGVINGYVNPQKCN